MNSPFPPCRARNGRGGEEEEEGQEEGEREEEEARYGITLEKKRRLLSKVANFDFLDFQMTRKRMRRRGRKRRTIEG